MFLGDFKLKSAAEAAKEALATSPYTGKYGTLTISSTSIPKPTSSLWGNFKSWFNMGLEVYTKEREQAVKEDIRKQEFELAKLRMQQDPFTTAGTGYFPPVVSSIEKYIPYILMGGLGIVMVTMKKKRKRR